MNALLIAIGSHGDVHPFIGIGLGLKARGFDVQIVTNALFEPLVRQAGLGFIAMGTAEEFQALVSNPDLWDERRGKEVVFKGVAAFVRPVYDIVVEHYVPGQTIVAASSLAMGARIAQDKLGIPTATVHLQPIDFRSLNEAPILPGRQIPRMPAWALGIVFWMVDRLMIDRWVCLSINSLRRELGLRPVKRILNGWWNSPQLVVGLFPDWFARPQPDWPPNTHLTGFPLFDESGMTPLPESLRQFLAEGSAPIAFTPGSAMMHGQQFLSESARACERLGRRGLLLTRHADHLPARLPPGVIHVAYAPFSELLPHCAALVHHGGIGTSAQALAAGVRQLVMPMSHDQPDNAARLARLGVARVLLQAQYRAPAVAVALEELLSSADVTARCAEVSQRLKGCDAIAQTCELLERLARKN